jgi:aspartate aminotransferase-like enzyme
MRKILFIPGPTEVDTEVLVELSKPILPHYGSDWNEIYVKTCEAARKVFRTSRTVLILPVPGTISMEMSAANIVEKEGDEVINVSNGYFGEVQGEILAKLGAKVFEVKSEYVEHVNIEKVRELVDLNPNVKAIYAVHNETSTGVLNNVREIAKIARGHDKLCVVDAISSYGGVDFDFDGWGIDYAVGYASKCIASVNGVCPVAISDRFVDFTSRKSRPAKSYYMNLPLYLEESAKWARIGHPHPTSMPASVIRAFSFALNKALEEGLEKRYGRHARIGRAYRDAIRAMGLDILPKEAFASPVVTAMKVPYGYDGKIRSLLDERFGLVVASSFGPIEGKIIRIAHMGNTANPQYLIQMIPALEVVLKELGIINKIGSGIGAAAKSLWG